MGIVTFLPLLAMAAWAIALGMTAWGTCIAFRHINDTREQATPDEALPPISILKPLKGAESGMEENIESFFHQDYPSYEILFSIADAHDPVREPLMRLMAKYPGIPTRLIVGDVEIGPNPKVNNLIRSYDQAKHDCVLISDSNVRVSPEYLRRAVACLGPGVGVVTAVVAGRNGRGVGGHLEAVYLNSFYARWMEIARAFGLPFVVGKSMLFRRSTAARFGGMQNLARYIAEDYMAGQAMKRLGLRVQIMPDPIPQFIGNYSIKAFWSRHIRWGRIRKAQAPIAFVFEPLLGSLVSGLLGGWAFHRWLGISPWLFLVCHLALWFFFDALLIWKVGAALGFREFFAWVLRECLALPQWLHIASGSGVHWRGNRLKILPGGIVTTL